MSAGGRLHLCFGLALLAPVPIWLAVFRFTALGQASAPVRQGSLAGLILALLAALLGYATLLWAGGAATTEGPERAAAELRRSQRVVGVYVAGALLRLGGIFGAALALGAYGGLSVGAVLLTAAGGYVPLSIVEMLLLARHWAPSSDARSGKTGGEDRDVR